jgi:hypothetical protein
MVMQTLSVYIVVYHVLNHLKGVMVRIPDLVI